MRVATAIQVKVTNENNEMVKSTVSASSYRKRPALQYFQMKARTSSRHNAFTKPISLAQEVLLVKLSNVNRRPGCDEVAIRS